VDETLAAAIAQQEARKVAKATLPLVLTSEVERQLPPVVEAQLLPIVAAAVPGLVDAAYAANPPANGRDGVDGKAALDGTNGQDGTNGTNGTDGADGDSIAWRGHWTKGTYHALDAVELDGSSYIATATTRTKPPGAGWDLMAQKGRDGGTAGRSYNVRGFASGMVIDDEGSRLNGGAVIGEIDFAGAGVTATLSGSKALITIPGGGGGSSLTVLDEGVVLDTAVSSINVVGADAVATNVGHAVTLTVQGPLYRQSADPGAVGAGALWVDTTTPGTSDLHLQRRNAADSGWSDVLEQYVATGAVSLQASSNGGVTLRGDQGGFPGSLLEAAGGAGGSIQAVAAPDVNFVNSGATFSVAGGSDNFPNAGGDVSFTAGTGSASGANGGNVLFTAGNGDGTTGNGGDITLVPGTNGGAGSGTNGNLKLTDGTQATGSAGQVLTAQGDTTALWGSIVAALIASGHQAAFVTPATATPEAIATSLIAAGLMAAS
jgi:trimeric autotransporter adhesin